MHIYTFVKDRVTETISELANITDLFSFKLPRLYIFSDLFHGSICFTARGLKDVQQIQSNDRAFAVIMSNGTVASWGIGDAGGDSSEVQDLLKDVRHIQVGVLRGGVLGLGGLGVEVVRDRWQLK